jgi:hypothetical protein
VGLHSGGAAGNVSKDRLKLSSNDSNGRWLNWDSALAVAREHYSGSWFLGSVDVVGAVELISRPCAGKLY